MKAVPEENTAEVGTEASEFFNIDAALVQLGMDSCSRPSSRASSSRHSINGISNTTIL